MRYRLRTLLIVLAGVGPMCLGLRSPTPWWSWLFFLTALVTLLTSVLIVIYRRGQSRAFAVGYLVFGGTFLTLLLLANRGQLAATQGINPISAMAITLYDHIHSDSQDHSGLRFIAFMEIIHSVFTLVLGVLGGYIAQALSATQNK
jgi:hypothetical protein